MGPTYKETADEVPGLISGLRDPNLSPYLLVCSISDLISPSHESDRKIEHLTIFEGSPIRGKFHHEGNVGRMELYLPYEVITNKITNGGLSRIVAEAALYGTLIHAHQWARGDSFEGLTTPDDRDYIDSPLAREAIREEILYLAHLPRSIADKVLAMLHPDDPELQGNQKLQAFIDQTFGEIFRYERRVVPVPES